jgi:TolB-like protein
MERCRLNLIGPFGLFLPNGFRIEVSSQKAVALIALIVTAPGGVRSRRKLEAMLWGSRGPKQAQDSLRRELSNLRKVLALYGAGDLLITETKRVAMAIDRIDVDVFAIGLGLAPGPARSHGDFLEGLDLPDCDEFEDWLREERERVGDLLGLVVPEPAAATPSPSEVYGAALPTAADAISGAEPSLPPKPSLAVLPFSAPGAPGQAWLGIGTADEISVCLSAYPQLFIVSSAAARALTELGLQGRELAGRLGVRYLLEGTVIRDGEHLRVSAALMDARTGEQFWAESFIGSADTGFALQQQIAARIAPQIWTKVDSAERQRGLRISGPPVGDYERYWRANALSRSWDPESINEAVTLSMELVERDPTCPWAASLAAYCHSVAWMLALAPDRETVLRRAIQSFQAAMRYGADNVEALGYCAGTLLNIGGDIELADRLIARALHLLPAHQPALFWGGWVDVLRGDPDRAVERFELAMRINPVSGVLGQMLAGIGLARILQGRVAEAVDILVEADKAAPTFPPAQLGLCVAAQLTGRTCLAHAIAAPLLARGGMGMVTMLRRPDHQALFAQSIEAAAQGAPAEAAPASGSARPREVDVSLLALK